MKKQIEKYRKARGYDWGFVFIAPGNVIAGWRTELGRASDCRPGTLAVNIDGQRWLAVGGDDHNGAEAWAWEKNQSG